MLIGAQQILAGSLTVGGLFTYTLFLGFLVVPLAQIAGIGTQLGEAIAGLERTHELLLEPTEDADPGRTVSLQSVEGDIVFDDVSFTYPSGEMVLSGISFRARPGTVTALVGSSGSGKSTIIGLVAAFYRPSQGRVMVDGVDLSTVRMDSYRSQLGVVFQDSFLFDGTIRDNVAFSRPDAAEAAVQKACETAHVKEFAERLASGYDTIVGERGIRLSGGQRQRISIARAVLADPKILILDEATSSLDSESESLIQQGLGHLMHGRTTLVIAHRLSTIRRADQILVIEGGRIVERGNHSTLHAARGRYYQLYERQHRFDADLFVPETKRRARTKAPPLPWLERSGDDSMMSQKTADIHTHLRVASTRRISYWRRARSVMSSFDLVANRFERYRALPSHVPVAIRQALHAHGGIDARWSIAGSGVRYGKNRRTVQRRGRQLLRPRFINRDVTRVPSEKIRTEAKSRTRGWMPATLRRSGLHSRLDDACARGGQLACLAGRKHNGSSRAEACWRSEDRRLLPRVLMQRCEIGWRS